MEVRDEVGRRQAKHPNSYPKSVDLLEASGFCVAILISQTLFRKMFTGIVSKSMIQKKQRWSHQVYGAKLVRCCDAFFKFVFYAAMTGLGFVILREEPHTPWPLGGSGTTRNCWTDNFPFQHVTPSLRRFYLVHIGYHISEFVLLLIETKHPDFWEMLLHGSLAISLCVISYMLNYVRIGSLVLLLHGCTDIFIYLSKAFVDTPYTRVTGVSYFLLVATYAWFRIFAYPIYVMKSAWVESVEEVRSDHIFGWGFLNFALCALLLLHMYWFGVILKIGVHYRNTGQTKDLQTKLSEMDLANQKGTLKAA
jgi:ceramide synthetase